MLVRQDRSHGLTAEGLHGGSVAFTVIANAPNSRAATETPGLRGMRGFLSGRCYRALKASVNAPARDLARTLPTAQRADRTPETLVAPARQPSAPSRNGHSITHSGVATPSKESATATRSISPQPKYPLS